MKIPLLSNLKQTATILSGVEIGVPLNIISKISTDVNFPNSIISYESVLFNFLLGFVTYKQDRYLDASEYVYKQNMITDFNITSNKKHDYYVSIINNEKSIQFTLFCSYIAICTFIYYNNLEIIIPLFTSTFLYKYLKQMDKISYFKPFYVAGMWTFCTCVIPLMLQSNFDYSMISFSLLSPTFLNLFALTNLADLKDYNEDFLNNINTLPIILGPLKTKWIILTSSILSTIMFINSPYFISNFQNLFYISCNIFPYFSLLNNSTNISN